MSDHKRPDDLEAQVTRPVTDDQAPELTEQELDNASGGALIPPVIPAPPSPFVPIPYPNQSEVKAK